MRGYSDCEKSVDTNEVMVMSEEYGRLSWMHF